MLLKLTLFLTNYSSFHTLLAHFPQRGNKPTSLLSQKGDKCNPLNYRLIAITSLISKTMETIITKQLLTFLETKNLLSDHKYGFRKARSTGDLLAYAVHLWSSTLESSGESRVILSISPRPLIAFGTRVFSLNCRCLVSIPFLLIGLVVSSLIGRLPSEWTSSSPICNQSMLVYPRALSSPLYFSSSSSMICSPPRLLAFTHLLMIPS